MAGQDRLPVLTEITEYQDTLLDENKKQKQIEIDLLGRNGKDILLVGECKFKNTPFDKADYEKLTDKIKYLPRRPAIHLIFSLSGFTDYVRNNAKHCRLYSIEDMYSCT